MAVFSVEDGRLTRMFGQMFGSNARNAASLPTPNISPQARPIAHPISFFIHSFLAKPTFFSGPLQQLLPYLLAELKGEIFFKISHFTATYPHYHCG
ncbi:hypothetical protein [Hymenobacter artigasi]|uniref:hypothetical protein n=1 Tax=Hymenobacter artigasi TaxID=2719616 RepID=UPI001B2FE841|nr:hypothetical protein [Hymenobacter artigasi]